MPVEVLPLPKAPTSGEIMSALRIRDEIADRISRVNHPSEDSAVRGRVPKMHAKMIAERLIGQGLIDTANVHAAIIEGRDDEPDGEDPFNEED